MRRNYTYIHLWIIPVILVIFMNFSFTYGGKMVKDTTDLHAKRLKRTSYLKNGLPFALPPLRPGVTSYTPVKFVPKPDDKLLYGVEASTNPVNDQLNLKYVLTRNSNVSIKIMDVLGNEVLTVFSDRVDLGEQKITYSLNNKLSRGFYFLRIAAGSESVIKRINVL